MKRIAGVIVGIAAASAGCRNLLGFGEPGLASDAAINAPPDAACAQDDTMSCFEGPGQAGVGQCSLGIATCESGAWGACTGQGMPTVEQCNGTADENCDGAKTCTGAFEAVFTTGGGRFRNLGLDGQGAIYTLGSYTSAYSIGSMALPAGQRGEISMLKQRADRSVVWAKGIASLGYQIPQALAVSADGALTIAGLYSADPGEQFMIGTRRLTAVNVTVAQSFLARFDADGAPLWAVTVKADLGYALTDRAQIATDASGSVYWLQSNSQKQYGYFDGPTPGGSPDPLSPQSALRVVHLGADGHLIGFSPDAWPSMVDARGIALDAAGDIYVAVVNAGVSFPIGTGTVVTVPTGGSIVKLDPTFHPLKAIAVSGSPTKLVNGPTGTLYVAGEAPAFVQQINANDTLGWSVSASGAVGSSIAVDAAGYVIVAGACTGPTDLNPSGSGGDVSGTGACVAKYASDGAFQWATAASIANVVAADVGVAAFGEIIVAGDYAPSANFGGGPLSGSGSFVLPMLP